MTWKMKHEFATNTELTLNGQVVLVIPLEAASRETAGLPRDSVLVIHMNAHPRPSFSIPATSCDEPLIGVIVERLGFARAAAEELAAAIERVIGTRTVSE